MPRWKQQLNNTNFALNGGHVIKHFQPQLEWRSLEKIIDGNDLSYEAVHFLCSLSIFVPETHKLYKSVANGTVHTSLIEPFQVEWIIHTSRKDFNEIYKYVCNMKGVRNWKAIENMLKDESWNDTK